MNGTIPHRSKLSRKSFIQILAGVLLTGCLSVLPLPADDASGTAELRRDESFDPAAYISLFSDFDFELRNELQSPESFLKRKSGDCDDFASLMKTVLDERGYSTRLVVVMMEGQTHVVCYVAELEGYLDYNLRSSREPVTPSTGALEDIGKKVASYFESNWRMASEIRYENGLPVYLDSVFQ